MALLDELGAPVGSLQVVAGRGLRPGGIPAARPRLQLGPKTMLAEFGEVHPRVLKALDVAGPMLGLRAGAGGRARAQEARPTKTKPAFDAARR